MNNMNKIIEEIAKVKPSELSKDGEFVYKKIKEKLEENIEFYKKLEYQYTYVLGNLNLSMKTKEIKEKIEILLEIL